MVEHDMFAGFLASNLSESFINGRKGFETGESAADLIQNYIETSHKIIDTVSG